LGFEIEFDPDALKDLRQLDKPVQQRRIGFLKERVAPLKDPRQIGEALTGATLCNYLSACWHAPALRRGIS